jgi:hypothetical protein
VSRPSLLFVIAIGCCASPPFQLGGVRATSSLNDRKQRDGRSITRGLQIEIGSAKFVLGYLSEEFSYFSATVCGRWKSLDVDVLMAAAMFLQAVSLRVGYNVTWIAILTDVFAPRLSLHTIDVSAANRYPPIPYTADHNSSVSFLRNLYQALCSQEKHTLRVFPKLLFKTLGGHFETSAATLGPAIESLAMHMTDCDLVQKTESFSHRKKIFDSAKKELAKFISKRPADSLTPAFGRLSGLISSAKFINVGAALGLIEIAYGITVTKQERDAFSNTRNPLSHGAVSSFTEEQFENFYQCMNLYYKLILAYLSYDGDVIAYSHPGFQLASYSCHRHGILAYKHSLDHNEIAKRAYLLWQHRGESHGQDLTDWIMAECQLSNEATTQRFGFGTNKLARVKTT